MDIQAWVATAQRQWDGGRLDAAVACFRRALALQPFNADILTQLAAALDAQGFREQAIRTLRSARVSADVPDSAMPEGLFPSGVPSSDVEQLGRIRERARRLQQEGKLGPALELHREALAIAPHLAGIWLSAGMLADALGEQWSSLFFFEEAARLNPSLLPAVESARRICVAAGLAEKAARYGKQVLALAPSDDIRIAQTLLLPAIQPSLEALHETRRAYALGLDELMSSGVKISDPAAALGLGAYFLAYHGENDAALQSKAAAFVAGAVPALSVTAAHCRSPARRSGRIRIAFISRFFFSHSIGATSHGLIQELSRSQFEVIVLRITPSRRDQLTDKMLAGAERWLDLDPDFRVAREQIADLKLDILFFQDIGMEPTSYLLACSRLARVQCVSFGHPNTTGIATMDYFISNDLYEPPEAQEHYTEKLFMLHDLPTLAYYHRPAAPQKTPERVEFGLHEEDHVYLCPQALCKLHPEFDVTLGQILRADPSGVLVLISGGYPDCADQIRQRLSPLLRGDIARVLMLDGMPFPRFMRLLACADVCLDTLHFNGMNSSLEAFSLGVPIVTLPGRLQRGRHTQAMYRKMNILDCIAKDQAQYAEIALRLGSERAYSDAMRERIRSRNHFLFEDRRVVEEFERFFLHAAG